MSLAHHGLLFMDEFPEFARDALEALREPLETSEICVARVRDRVRLPADILLVAAMNPCPCGYFGTLHARRACRCTPDRILRYRSRISGPLLDRFDLAIHLESDTGNAGSAAGEKQAQMLHPHVPGDAESPAALVRRVRQIALARQSCTNARLDVDMLKEHAVLDSRSEKLLQETARSKGWSMRARHRVQRVARTLADIGNSPDITWPHLAEAIELRRALDLV
jgi:magnesium chelatase family protein